MILKSDEIYKRLNKTNSERLVITPPLNKEDVKKSHSTSVDLRLGTRFLSTKHSRTTSLDIESPNNADINKQHRLMESHFVRFGNKFFLHPRDFILGVTLEWIQLPFNLSGYVQGRSSWGRRGLIIAMAVGVHSGFSGCLTLELTNLGEVPIAIYPGMTICQLFLHDVKTSSTGSDSTIYYGKSRPTLGSISLDKIALKLKQKKSH